MSDEQYLRGKATERVSEVPDQTQASHTTTLLEWGVFFGVALLALVLDQVTKAYASAHLDLHESWMPLDWLRPIFRFTLTHNTGAAFGMFKDSGPVFSVIALVVAGVILYYYSQLERGNWLIRLALGLQLAGALGNNVVDRPRQGYVVDFLHVPGWPIFNVADSCIVVGVTVLLLVMLYQDWQASRTQKPSEGDTPA